MASYSDPRAEMFGSPKVNTLVPIGPMLAVGTPRLSPTAIRKLRSRLRRKANTLERLASLFPVYFYHQSVKANDNAGYSIPSVSPGPSVETLPEVQREVQDEYTREERKLLRSIQGRRKLSGGSDRTDSSERKRTEEGAESKERRKDRKLKQVVKQALSRRSGKDKEGS